MVLVMSRESEAAEGICPWVSVMAVCVATVAKVVGHTKCCPGKGVIRDVLLGLG
jgi:hypothetical protein